MLKPHQTILEAKEVLSFFKTQINPNISPIFATKDISHHLCRPKFTAFAPYYFEETAINCEDTSLEEEEAKQYKIKLEEKQETICKRSRSDSEEISKNEYGRKELKTEFKTPEYSQETDSFFADKCFYHFYVLHKPRFFIQNYREQKTRMIPSDQAPISYLMSKIVRIIPEFHMSNI